MARESTSSYSSNLWGVTLSTLMMGLALVAIIIAYIPFGHIGPNFCSSFSQIASIGKETI